MIDRYAVIGNPVAHSKSPFIHTAFAQQTGQALSYTTLECALEPARENLRAALQRLRDDGGRGANVTVPFKLEAAALADECRDAARLAGAANALRLEEDGRIVADNFDGVGLLRDLQDNLGTTVRGRRVLLLGAGGAARGALLPLLHAQPAVLVVANRNADRAHALGRAFASLDTEQRLRTCGLDDLQGERFNLLLNATSASLTDSALPLPPSVFDADALAYDMVYGRGLTPFLRSAQAAGVTRLADGVGMLVEQAAEAFVWWRGVRPNTRPVIDALRVPIA